VRWRSHVLLPIFFVFSYSFLVFPLQATRSMGDMPGSTFRTSRTERFRRRTDGPALTLVRGAGGSFFTTSRDLGPVHPGQPGFTPDGVPSDARFTAVQDSEPGSPPIDRTSRGNASLDTEGTASTGSGPIDHRYLLLDRVAEFLEAYADDQVDTEAATGIHGSR
jgi:hypothetical protein